MVTQNTSGKYFGVNKGHNFGTNLGKITHNNPKLNLVNMNAYIIFGGIMSIFSQDIEGKRNSGVNQGP